jgi:cob(I)alamin adenosyltransferase
MAKIYTKTGDKGSTSLVAGTRLSKAHIRIEAYGCVDELNAHIGLLADLAIDSDWKVVLNQIQNELFVLGSHLANDSDEMKKHLPALNEKLVGTLENEIDKYTKILPALKHFILPGGLNIVSQAHISRTVCRRAEREVIKLSETESIDNKIIVMLNRLSDYLFVLSRFIAFENNVPEKIWIGSNKV